MLLALGQRPLQATLKIEAVIQLGTRQQQRVKIKLKG